MDRLRALFIGSRSIDPASAEALGTLGFMLDQCPRGVEAFDRISRFHPDLVIVDCDACFDGGIQFCRSLRATPEIGGIPLVVVAEDADDDRRLAALEAGADECLSQPIAARDSMLRIRALNRRVQHCAAPRVLLYEKIELEIDNFKVRRNGVLVPVPRMQFRLLQFLLENPTIVFSRQELLKAVWGGRDLDEGAVTASMVRLRRALNSAGGPNLIRNVKGRGYSVDALNEI